jgi:hypothetical protein
MKAHCFSRMDSLFPKAEFYRMTKLAEMYDAGNIIRIEEFI